MKNSILVRGMSCQHCTQSVTAALEKYNATDISIDLLSGNVTFDTEKEIQREELLASICQLGFEAE